jgi:hypothetical protein
MSGVRLSVVIPAVSGLETAQRCEASIRRLEGSEGVEVILVPARPGATVCELRAEGVRRASGARIAVVGDRYEVTPQWLEAALSASLFDAVGGSVSPSARLGYFGWCVYLSEYVQLAPPLGDGPISDPRGLPGGNTVYRSGAVDPARLAACGTELLFHAGLLASGARAARLSALEVVLATPPGVRGYLLERFGFSYAIARERGQPIRALLSPLLPIAVMIRTGSASLLRPRHGWRWLAGAPVILAFALVQAAGDLLGHAAAGMSSYSTRA